MDLDGLCVPCALAVSVTVMPAHRTQACFLAHRKPAAPCEHSWPRRAGRGRLPLHALFEACP